LILTHIRIHCVWLWRWLTFRQWSALPHIMLGKTPHIVAGAAALVCAGGAALVPRLIAVPPVLTYSPAVQDVPEPSSLAVFMVGVVGVAVLRKGRKL